VRGGKERKETANVPLGRICGWQRFGGGYKRRRPRSRGSRDPSFTAPFASIAPDGAEFPAAQSLRTANVGLPSEARANNCREPWIYASQQMDESPRRSLGESFGAFLLSEKSTYLSPLKRRRNML